MVKGTQKSHVAIYGCKMICRTHDANSCLGGTVRVKIARNQGRIVNLSPESDDCRRVAAETGASWKDVWTEALARGHAKVKG